METDLLQGKFDLSVARKPISSTEAITHTKLKDRLAIGLIFIFLLISLFVMPFTKLNGLIVQLLSLATFLASFMLIVLVSLKNTKYKMQIERFAKANSLKCAFNQDPTDTGIYFEVGSVKKYSILLSDDKTTIGNYHFTVGNGDNKTYCNLLVMSTTLPKTLPETVVVCKKSRSIFNSVPYNMPSQMDKLKLEPESAKYFDVYCNDKDKIVVGGVFAPDLLHELMSLLGEADLEIIGDRLYLYNKSVSVSLLDELEPQLAKFRSIYMRITDNINL